MTHAPAIRHARLGFFFGLGLCVLLLAGCPPKVVKPKAPGGADPAPVWSRFVQESRATSEAPRAKAFNLNAALHYSSPKTASRLAIHFWGNLDSPLRLDLQTGMGQTLGYWREDKNGFTAYVPDKKTAFLHHDGRLGMAGFGIALPFTMRELGLLLNGRWAGLFPETYVSARALPGKGFSYAFTQQGETYTLELDPEAKPLAMSTAGAAPWRLTFSDFEPADQANTATRLPKKIVMTRDPDEKVVIVIKKLEQIPELWPEEKLMLNLPPGTQTHIMDNTSALDREEPHLG